MTHDGIGKYLAEVVEKAPGETDDVVGILKETGTDVVVNYLPVGSEAATKWYAEQILEAGVAMVNCMPVFIAREPYWQKRFEEAGVPIIGDDIKSQVGATISHRVLTTLFQDRGVHLDRTMQLNVGGNSDFRNMLERERLESKKISKTNAVTSMLDYDIGADNVHVGPSDYVPWLTDRKWAYIRMEGSSFGDVPLNIELKLEVWDSPNSAGIVIDAVRLREAGAEQRHRGPLEAPSSYLMKSPPIQIVDNEARENDRALHQAERAHVGEEGEGGPQGVTGVGLVELPSAGRLGASTDVGHPDLATLAAVGLELQTAGELSDEELAALFTASYDGYLVPFAVDAAVRFLTEAYDLDRDASVIAVRDGERVGLANLGLRGADAWIGGVGVVPGERRRGTGRALMEAVHEQARSRGVERVWLEVIAENTGAIALYEALGYGYVRDVEVWSLPGAAGEATEVDADEAHAWIREHRVEREPWQRDDVSLRRSPSPAGFSSRERRRSSGSSAAASRSSRSPVTRSPRASCSKALARSATSSAC